MFRAAAVFTRRDPDAPKPEKKKQRGEGESEHRQPAHAANPGPPAARGRYAALGKAAKTAQPSPGAFADAARAMSGLLGWLQEFFEAEADPYNPLDPCNPDRDLVSGASDGGGYDADPHSSSGPSLDPG